MSKFRIARISLLLAAIGLNAAPALMTGAHAQDAKPAAEAPKDVVRPEVFKLVDTNVIRDLMAKKDYAEVQKRITAAEAIGNLNPYEQYVLNRMKIALGSATKNEAMTRAGLEAVIASGRLQPAEEADFTLVLANQDYNAKNYAKAIERYKRYQQLSPTPDKAAGALVRSYYLNNDFTAARDELLKIVDAADKAGKPVEKEDLRLLASAAGKMKDWPNYTRALEKLVLVEPSDEFWVDVLNRGVVGKPGFDNRLTLDFYRLMNTAISKMEAADYVDMAEQALVGGFFVEAKKVVDAGFAAGVLGAGADAAKHKALRDKVTKNAADDIKSIAAGEASAAKLKDGMPLVNLGYAYVTMDQFDKGIKFIEQGIAKGVKKPDEAQLKLGAALVKAGRKDEAIKVFQNLKGPGGATDLAKYWVLLLNSPTKLNTGALAAN